MVLRHDRDRNQADPRRQGRGGKTNGTVDLPSEIFDATANIALMHQVVVAQLAAARQGTHSTKTAARSAVVARSVPPEGHGAHVRARPVRRSSRRWHRPRPAAARLLAAHPKKMKAAALRGALSDRAATSASTSSPNGRGQVPSTKTAKSFLGELSDRKKSCWSSAARTSPRGRASRTWTACTPSHRPAQHLRRAQQR
ncbi:50S ribosomal protein L4 [Rhodococcus hoagii]|nr:50S ribosomal protein L4 [Prescottella equi]